VRIALHPTTEIGHRAGRILLAEADLTALGIYGHRGRGTEDRRSMAVTDLAGFALLASDDRTAPLDLAALAAADGLSCVLAADVDPPASLADSFAGQGLTLLAAASLPGLADALRFHEAALLADPQAAVVAWTIGGKPLRLGEAVPFPSPLGARWGRRLAARAGDPPLLVRMEVPVEGTWAGALARVTGTAAGRAGQRLVGVADHRQHLEALALAAGALAIARGHMPGGLCRPSHGAAGYLAEASRLGLALAGLEAAG
jgi:hypothetical protein